MSLLKRIERGQTSGGEELPGGAQQHARRDESPAMRPTRQQVHGMVGQASGVDIKDLVQRRLLDELGPGETFDMSRSEELRVRIDEIFTAILQEEGLVLARNERRRLHEQHSGCSCRSRP